MRRIWKKPALLLGLTTDRLSKKANFWKNLRKAIAHGLSETTALKALTETPAQLMGVSDMVGSLKAGMVANFIISSGNIFEEDSKIYENWIQGKAYSINDMNAPDLNGKYILAVADQSYNLEITGKQGSPKGKIVLNDTTDIKVNLSLDGEMLNLSFNPIPKDKSAGMVSLSGWTQEKNMQGSGQLVDGNWVNWTANYDEPISSTKKTGSKAEGESSPEVGDVIYPFVAYGNKEIPKQENILIKNATVWTMEEDGILENTDVLLENGKITRIGQNLIARGVRVIDGTGKHLSPGIIDEHSHIGASSINDVGTNSSMVRISDVIDSEDQEIYRALSGGVTAIQILHGSANPIGGQSALIKLRWGHNPEALKIKEANGYIKFALGENVKRSRSSNSIPIPTKHGWELSRFL